MLIPYAKNARTHTDAQVAAIAASIREWGWTSPALVGEDGGLIAGHARILAARQLGIAEVPVMVAAGWSEAQKRAYVLADNQLAITGSGWDPELLRLELGEIGLEARVDPARAIEPHRQEPAAGSAGHLGERIRDSVHQPCADRLGHAVHRAEAIRPSAASRANDLPNRAAGGEPLGGSAFCALKARTEAIKARAR